jgi:hypothetical protein
VPGEAFGLDPLPPHAVAAKANSTIRTKTPDLGTE